MTFPAHSERPNAREAAIVRKFIIAATILSATSMPAFAQSTTTNVRPAPIIRGAPGPIVGAGLPVLALGYGVYWLAKRRRKTK